MKTHTREFQQTLTPRLAFQVLKEGNDRFVNNLKLNRNLLQQVNDTRDGQFPFAVALSCMDSRVSVELIFDQGLGDMFSVRVAGNIVNPDVIGSMEYACKVAGSKLIVVLGHTRCGAIKGAADHVQMGNLTGLLEKIKPAAGRINHSEFEHLSELDKYTYANVLHSIDMILSESDIIRSLYSDGRIGIVGGIYSVETGHVNFIRTMFNERQKEKAALL
ncbi:MAG: carbonic anhydrase [Chitinophagaceae bacterium]|nr:carbonic anhydrase [Chitinophagaceae bacterium]